MPRAKNILHDADKLTSLHRRRAYGHPRENITQTADLWSAYMAKKLKRGVKVTPRDVGWMMALVKASRDTHRMKRDNLVDGAGWLRVGELVTDERLR